MPITLLDSGKTRNVDLHWGEKKSKTVSFRKRNVIQSYVEGLFWRPLLEMIGKSKRLKKFLEKLLGWKEKGDCEYSQIWNRSKDFWESRPEEKKRRGGKNIGENQTKENCSFSCFSHWVNVAGRNC